MSSQTDTESWVLHDSLHLEDHSQGLVGSALASFDRVIKRSFFINTCFFLLGLGELVILLGGFAFFSQSYTLAFLLALIFFTFFSFFTFRLYEKTLRPERFRTLSQEYVEGLKSLHAEEREQADYYIALAAGCVRLANKLHAREYTYYQTRYAFKSLGPLLERFSCWCYWSDILSMQEVLLQKAVDTHIELVKRDPTSLEAHAHLANAYVMLSGLYIDPRKTEGFDPDRWIPSEKFGYALEERFRTTAERAIEEFKILGAYAPGDPWVHFQLAYSYHDLHMPLEEIREYETILTFTPNDPDVMHKLGILYFQQGMNAMGLKCYEKLMQLDPRKAGTVIQHYGDVYRRSGNKL